MLYVVQVLTEKCIPTSNALNRNYIIKALNPNRFNVWVVLGWDVVSSSARRPATLWVEARRVRWETPKP